MTLGRRFAMPPLGIRLCVSSGFFAHAVGCPCSVAREGFPLSAISASRETRTCPLSQKLTDIEPVTNVQRVV